jgi:hypothetical protein
LNDGWSVGGITQNISDTLLVLNFENGAHHSDLSAVGPSDRDTLDIQHGYVQIASILKEWLDSLSQHEHKMQPMKDSRQKNRAGSSLSSSRLQEPLLTHIY